MMQLQPPEAGPVAMWAGLECTINRVGDHYFDQLARNGHYTRPEDIDLLTGLGIQSVRYPVLWEKHQPTQDTAIDWTFTTQSLARLYDSGVTPIAGLVHHGSGPDWVNFYDGSFEAGLTAYAAQVAQRFPWLEYYTPVNEPLTTARFCGLYGLWYPHGSSDEHFVRILVAECKATVMAMAAIRRIQPAAKLVQTDDLGRIYSNTALAYQADYENERRWLAWDLISGKVTPAHPLWNYLIWSGIDEGELYFLLEHATPPAIIGVNHYITSNRFLDDELEHYPAHLHGGNGIHQYADVEAVRVLTDEPIASPKDLLLAAWERYHLPVAITEAHLQCSREQQGRWLLKVWEDANALKAAGVDVRAVTAWAVFGSHGWNNLLTRPDGDYESGLFDTRFGVPQPTALAKLVKQLAEGDHALHPSFYGDGWWTKSSRLSYGAKHLPIHKREANAISQPLLILGRNGTLGKAFSRVCHERHITHLLWGREELNLLDNVEVMAARLKEIRPWTVINATGYVRVDDAEEDTAACFDVNRDGVVKLAEACEMAGVKLLSFSSDLVFGGTKDDAYTEADTPAPLNAYGRSKAAADSAIEARFSNALIIRTSAFFSPWDEYNFVTVALREIRAGRRFAAADDLIITPTYVPDLVHQCLDLLIDEVCGIRHLSNAGAISWAGLARMTADMAGLDAQLVIAKPAAELNWRALRPRNAALGTLYGQSMPTLESALQRYFLALASPEHQPAVTAMA